MRPTLRKERDSCLQSTGSKMNVLEMGLTKVYKLRQSGLLMNESRYSVGLLIVNIQVLYITH